MDNINKDDAAVALASIEAAGARSSQVQRYRRAAPYLIVWGTVWVLANGAAELTSDQSGAIWLILSLLGAAASGYIGWQQRRVALEDARSDTGLRDQMWRCWLSILVIVAFITTAIAVLPPMDSRQQDTFISIFWTFLYLALGAWMGWRLFTIGLIATILIVVGFYAVHAHYFLYMACVSGGALIAGGLWLRRP